MLSTWLILRERTRGSAYASLANRYLHEVCKYIHIYDPVYVRVYVWGLRWAHHEKTKNMTDCLHDALRLIRMLNVFSVRGAVRGNLSPSSC